MAVRGFRVFPGFIFLNTFFDECGTFVPEDILGNMFFEPIIESKLLLVVFVKFYSYSSICSNFIQHSGSSLQT